MKCMALQEGDDCTSKSKLDDNFICRENLALDCLKADGKNDLALCSNKDFLKADKELNIVYQKVLKSLQTKPNDDNSDYKEARRRLIEAQKIWIKFRDAECSIGAAFNLYGSVQAAEEEMCRKEMTEKRTKEIRGYGV